MIALGLTNYLLNVRLDRAVKSENVGFSPSSPGLIYQFVDDFRTNLADREENRYVIMKIALVYGTSEGGYARYFREVVETDIKRYENQIQDIITSILNSKTAEEIESLEGRMELKRELVIKLNNLLWDGKSEYIYDVYYEYINVL